MELRVVYDYDSSFNELLEIANGNTIDMTIHILITEIYKF